PIGFREASVATAPLGASAVPINWHWRIEEIAHVLGDSGAKALVVHADLWPEIAASVPNGTSVVVVPASEGSTASFAPPPDGAVSWEQLASAAEPLTEAPAGARRLRTTSPSGTPGRPS